MLDAMLVQWKERGENKKVERMYATHDGCNERIAERRQLLGGKSVIR